MSRLAVLSCVLVTGCFYIDPINQRPSIDIRQTSSTEVYRKSPVTLEAVSNDPEEQLVYYQWRVYACDDASDFSTCDQEPFESPVLDHIEFMVPERRTDVDVPVKSLLVILEAQDEYGAVARPRQELIIAVSNHAPVITLSTRSSHGGVVGTPIDVYAKLMDDDDGPANALPLTWKVYSPPTQPTYTLVEIDVIDPNPTQELQLGQRLTPDGEGMWHMDVTATDPLGATDTETINIPVGPDTPPCITQFAPIVAPGGGEWPLTSATLFQVNYVDDDLDAFPTIPGDAVLGTATFAWSIKPPGGARTPLAFDGSAVALDPANYAPGDIVELRVEVDDRKNRDLSSCGDAATCTLGGNSSCTQRLTWRVEVQ